MPADRSDRIIAGLVVAPNGAQMWVSGQNVHVAVLASEPYALVYIDGVCITPPPPLAFGGVIGSVAAFDRPLTRAEMEKLQEAGE